MKITLGLAVLSSSLLLAACEDPAANKAKAITSNVAVATGPVSTAVKGEVLAINPENSKVLFTGSKMTGSHDGGFRKFSGTIDLVNDNAAASAVTVDIDTTSVFTDADGLTKHLRSKDFFDVEKFPKASFVSRKIEMKGVGEFDVTGDLSLHGQTKSITFPATIRVGSDAVEVNADFSINRKDFGIVYTGTADDLIRDDVVIKLELRAERKK